MNPYQRRAASFNNEMRRSCGALLGIVQGILSDQQVHDSEVTFLKEWLINNEVLASTWPGDILLLQINQILHDGIITTEEREHLTQVLVDLIGGRLDELAESTHVTKLALDQAPSIDFNTRRFCLTGDFVFGPRSVCENAIIRRGGEVQSGVTKKLDFLVVGGLGSPEWKHGSFGTKIEKAISYRNDGVKLMIVHEDVWASSLSLFQVTLAS